MDEAEHLRRVDALLGRFDSAAERVFAAADRLFKEIDEAEDREDERIGDAVRVGPRTKARWHRLDRLAETAHTATESLVSWAKFVAAVSAERPASGWGRWRQRRRLRSVAKSFERTAVLLERLRP
jgi:hypothetical protein